MIRPFDLRDMALIRRLAAQGIPLYAEAALTGQTRPLLGALLSYMSVGLLDWGTPTFVIYDRIDGHSVAGFVQMQHRVGADQARLIYMSPVAEADSPLGMAMCSLLETLVVAAGERGAQSLVAEVADESAELFVLRRAGFAVYARQDVWRLDISLPASSPLSLDGNACRLRPRRSADAWGISVLYANTAPRLLQMAEPLSPWRPSNIHRGYVLEEKGEIVAYVEICEGTTGVWLKALLHPEAEGCAGAVIAGTLSLVRRQPGKTIFWNVRRYQDWLRGPLTEYGFEPWLSQAVLVKHTVARIEGHEGAFVAGLEKRTEVTAPLVHFRPGSHRYEHS